MWTRKTVLVSQRNHVVELRQTKLKKRHNLQLGPAQQQYNIRPDDNDLTVAGSCHFQNVLIQYRTSETNEKDANAIQ